jgi:uncharacterized protein
MEPTLFLAVGGLLAGAFGALLGLGGGILIVPLLTLGFGVPFTTAVGTSLLAVITTSCAGAAAYLRRGTANLPLAMTLELATALGALAGGLIAFALPDRVLYAAFAAMLAYVAVSMVRGRGPAAEGPVVAATSESGVSARRAPGTMTSTVSGDDYTVRRLPAGLAFGGLGGVTSALLGVGGGTVLVPAMHLLMGVPLRVATATSTLMIGVTASTSAVLYLLRGAIDPLVAGPVVLGVVGGAIAASRLAPRVPLHLLRVLFVAVLAYVALEMAARAGGSSLVELLRR